MKLIGNWLELLDLVVLQGKYFLYVVLKTSILGHFKWPQMTHLWPILTKSAQFRRIEFIHIHKNSPWLCRFLYRLSVGRCWQQYCWQWWIFFKTVANKSASEIIFHKKGGNVTLLNFEFQGHYYTESVLQTIFWHSK